MTSTSIKFKCKSWIDTFGQRGAKATGSIITNAFATSVADLNKYVSFRVTFFIIIIIIVVQLRVCCRNRHICLPCLDFQLYGKVSSYLNVD